MTNNSTLSNEQSTGANLPADQGPNTQTALNQQQADWAANFEQETGHKDVKSLMDAHQQALSESQAQGNGFKVKYETLKIESEILAASGEAVSPAFVKDFLAGKAVCDENGIVTVDGKPVADAIKKLLDDNPFLAKPQGSTGSGAATTSSSPLREMSRDEFNRLSPSERRKFTKDGGTIV